MKKIILNSIFVTLFVLVSACSNDDDHTSSTTCNAPQVSLNGSASYEGVSLTWTVTSGNYEYVLNTNANAPTTNGTLTTDEGFDQDFLSPSTTYYFHVRSVCGESRYSAWTTFTFTTQNLPFPDECSTATPLFVGADYDSNSIEATNVSATQSVVSDDSNLCGDYNSGDVWFKVMVPASGNLSIETYYPSSNNSPLYDTVLAVYEGGACGELSRIDCDDDNGLDTYSMLGLTGRTPGEILYVRVYGFAQSTGSFSISAYNN